MDLTTIAKLVAGEGGRLRLRQAEVTAVAGDGTLTVLIGGSGVPVSGVKAFASVAPVVGESVWMVTDGVDLIAIGAIGASSGGSGGLPSGAIIMWSGTLTTIPAGYALCDGNTGTPNLIDKFIKGVATASTDPGATGGAATHTHAAHAAHQHTAPATGAADRALYANAGGDHSHGGATGTGNGPSHFNTTGSGNNGQNYAHTHSIGASGSHAHTVTDHLHHGGNATTGGPGAEGHDSPSNLPPYYALAYIMKL